MNVRVLLLGFVCLLSTTSAQVYLRGERFGTSPRNWKPTNPAQFYGFEVTDITGNKGAAGGLLLPTRYFNRYADIFLGGNLQRDNRISASGRLALVRASARPQYVATAYIGHFSQRFDRFVQTVGIGFTGGGETTVAAQAIVEFSDGSAYASDPVAVRIAPKSDYVDWSYSWNPGAGEFGYGQLIIRVGNRVTFVDLPPSSAGKSFALDAFGLFQPQFSSPDSNTFLQLFIGDVAYTAFIGQSPVVRVRGSKNIRTGGSTVDLKGTAKVAIGNRIKAVRYRIVRKGKARRYRNANGTTKWTASVRVPKGKSKIEVLARSDSGLGDTTEVRVRRR